MSQNLFVYGTLTFSEILEALTGKKFDSIEIKLHNYKRLKIIDDGVERLYPGIFKSEGDFVKGKLLLNVDDESLKILDFFEGLGYHREYREIQVEDRKLKILFYEWREKDKIDLSSQWNPEEFRQEHLSLYLEKIIPSTLKKYKSLINT